MNTSFELIAKFVNTHDDGTPAPRATVTPTGVVVRSTVYESTKPIIRYIESRIVTTMAEARALLGY